MSSVSVSAKALDRWLDKNETHLTGELSRDPESRYTPTGKLVVRFNLCTKYMEYCTFHACVAWNDLGERIASLKKGHRIKVVGRLQTSSWERNGQKRYRTEVVCWQVIVQGAEGSFTNSHGVEVSDADVAF